MYNELEEQIRTSGYNTGRSTLCESGSVIEDRKPHTIRNSEKDDFAYETDSSSIEDYPVMTKNFLEQTCVRTPSGAYKFDTYYPEWKEPEHKVSSKFSEGVRFYNGPNHEVVGYKKVRDKDLNCLVLEEVSRVQAEIPPNNNRKSEWMQGKMRPNDKYDATFKSFGVKFLKEISPSVGDVKLLRKLFPKVCTGTFDIEVLREAFRNLNAVLYVNQWFLRLDSLENLEKQAWKHLRSLFECDCVLQNLRSKSVAFKKRETDTMVFFLKSYKLCLRIFCGVRDNNVSKRLDTYFDSCNPSSGTTRISTKVKKTEFQSQMFNPLKEGMRAVGVHSFVKGLASTVIDSQQEVINAGIWQALGNFLGSVPGKIAEGVSSFATVGMEAITDLVTYMAGKAMEIKDSLLNVLETLCGYIDRTVLTVFGMAIAIFVLIYCIVQMSEVVSKLGKMVSCLYILFLEKLGYPPNKSALDLIGGLHEEGFRSQSLTTIAPLLGTICGITMSCISKDTAQAANSAVNFATRLPLFCSGLEECFGNIMDYMFFKICGTHWLAERSHYDEFEQFVEEFNEFISTPDIEKELITNLVLTEQLSRLRSRGKKLEGLVAIMKGEVKLQSALIRAISKVNQLDDVARMTSNYYKTRIETPLLWLYGEPGQGKTTVLEHIIAAVYKAVKEKFPKQFTLDWSKAHIHCRDKSSDFWEGYDGQFATVWNEAFEKSEARERVRTASELLTACEDGTYPLNMAFDQKGKLFFNSMLAVVTSNLSDAELKSKSGMSAPSALVRRRTMHLKVKKGDQFSPAKGNFDESWVFVLERPIDSEFSKAFLLGTPNEWSNKLVKPGDSVNLTFSDVVRTFVKEIIERIERRTDKTDFMREFDYVSYVNKEPAKSFRKVGPPPPPKPVKRFVEKKVDNFITTISFSDPYDTGEPDVRFKSQMFNPFSWGKSVMQSYVSSTGSVTGKNSLDDEPVVYAESRINVRSEFTPVIIPELDKHGKRDHLAIFMSWITLMDWNSTSGLRRNFFRLFKYVVLGIQYPQLTEVAASMMKSIFKDAGHYRHAVDYRFMIQHLRALSSFDFVFEFGCANWPTLFRSYLGLTLKKQVIPVDELRANDVGDAEMWLAAYSAKLIAMQENGRFAIRNNPQKRDCHRELKRLAKMVPPRGGFYGDVYKVPRLVAEKVTDFSIRGKELLQEFRNFVAGRACPYLFKYGHFICLGLASAVLVTLTAVGLLTVRSDSSEKAEKVVHTVPTFKERSSGKPTPPVKRKKRVSNFAQEVMSQSLPSGQHYNYPIRKPVVSQSLPRGHQHSLPPHRAVVSQSLPRGERYSLPIKRAVVSQTLHSRDPYGFRDKIKDQTSYVHTHTECDGDNWTVDNMRKHFRMWAYYALAELDKQGFYGCDPEIDDVEPPIGGREFLEDNTYVEIAAELVERLGYKPSPFTGTEEFSICVYNILAAHPDDVDEVVQNCMAMGDSLFFQDMGKFFGFSSQSDIGQQFGSLSMFMRTLRVHYGDQSFECEGVMSGRRFITPMHFFSVFGLNFTKVELVNNGIVTGSFFPSQAVVSEAPGFRDLCYVDFSSRSLNAQASMKHKLFKDEDDMYNNMSLSSEFSRIHKTIMSNGSIVIERIRRNHSLKGIKPITHSNVGKLDLRNYYILAGAMGEDGDCGLPYSWVDHTNVAKIVGVHSGLSGTNSYFVPIYQSDFVDEFYSQAYVPEWLQYTTPEVSPPTYNGKMIYMGQAVKKKIIPSKTNFLPTIAQGDHDNEPMYELTTAPALLVPTIMEDGTVVRPLHNAMLKLGRSPMRPLQKWMSDLVIHHPEIAFEGFFPSEMDMQNIREWTLEEVLFGIPGIWKGLSQDTAIGYDMECISNYKSRKEIWNKETRWISPILRQLVDKLDAAVQRGEVPKNVVAGCLKDEPRELERVENGNTRLFCIGSLSHLCWTVKWMGALVTEMKRNRSTSDVAIGTNPYGYDWKRIERMLNRFDSAVFGGGDFKDYDTSENPWFGWALGEACVPLYRFPAGSWKENCVRFACQSALAPILVVASQVYWLDYFNSSGGWLTGFLNSFVGIFIINTIFFYVIHSQGDENLKQLTRRQAMSLIVYGDDNVWSLHKSYEKVLNMVILAELVFKFFGMGYTTASKGEVSEAFVKQEDLEFLCRKFRCVGTVVYAPLARSSIVSMLMWIQKPNVLLGISVEDQFLQNVETACSEWFQHGEEVFNRETEHMKAYLLKHSLPWPGKSFGHYRDRFILGFNA